jgi:hypothetical protein
MYGQCAVASEALFAQSLLAEIGFPVEIRVESDISSAIAANSRSGLGRMKHVETKYLWLQGLVRQKRISLLKVPTLENTPDIQTKHLKRETHDKMCQRLGLDLCRPSNECCMLVPLPGPTAAEIAQQTWMRNARALTAVVCKALALAAKRGQTFAPRHYEQAFRGSPTPTIDCVRCGLPAFPRITARAASWHCIGCGVMMNWMPMECFERHVLAISPEDSLRFERVCQSLENLLAQPFIPPDKRPTKNQKRILKRLLQEVAEEVKYKQQAVDAIVGIRQVLETIRSNSTV